MDSGPTQAQISFLHTDDIFWMENKIIILDTHAPKTSHGMKVLVSSAHAIQLTNRPEFMHVFRGT